MRDVTAKSELIDIREIWALFFHAVNDDENQRLYYYCSISQALHIVPDFGLRSQ